MSITMAQDIPDGMNGGRPAARVVPDDRLPEPGFHDEAAQPSLFADSGDRTAISHWFELDRNACFLLSADLRLLDMNPAAERVLTLERFLAARQGRLTLGCERSDAVLGRAVAAISGHAPMRRRDFVRGADLEWRAIETIGVQDSAAVFIAFRPFVPLAERLSALSETFALTPAETSVLCALVMGRAPKDIGRDLGICTATVRTHLRSIFAKLDARGIAATLVFIISII